MVGHVIPCGKCGENFTKFSTISRETRCTDCRGGSRIKANKYAQMKKIRETSTDKVLKRIDSLEKKMEMVELTIEVGENEVNYLVNEFEHRAKGLLRDVVEEEITKMIADDTELATLLEKKFKLSLVKVQNNFNNRMDTLSERVLILQNQQLGISDYTGPSIQQKSGYDSSVISHISALKRRARMELIVDFIKKSKKGWVNIKDIMNYVLHDESDTAVRSILNRGATEGILQRVKRSNGHVQYHLVDGEEE